MTSSANQAAAEALAGMSDDELAAWVDAGDFSTIGGVALPEETSAQVAAIVDEAEVEGFTFAAPPGALGDGSHVDSLMRKAGGDPSSAGKPFLRFKFETVFTTQD